MAESRKLYEESVKLDPAIFQTLYGWARMEETDRNFARAGELLDAAEKLVARQPERPAAARDPARARQGLRRGAGRARRHRTAARGRRPRADRMEREGPAARPDGPLCGGLRRLRRGQADFARADRPDLSWREEAAGLARRLKAFFVAPRLKILPRAGVRSDVAQPIFIVGFPRSGTTMIEQTLERPSADQRRRRTADRQRADRPHPAHADEPARLSRGVRRALARRPGRGARQSARLLSAARPPARRAAARAPAGSPTRCR